MMPFAMILPTVPAAASRLANAASSRRFVAGTGNRRTVTSVTIPSMPSEPVNSASRS